MDFKFKKGDKVTVGAVKDIIATVDSSGIFYGKNKIPTYTLKWLDNGMTFTDKFPEHVMTLHTDDTVKSPLTLPIVKDAQPQSVSAPTTTEYDEPHHTEDVDGEIYPFTAGEVVKLKSGGTHMTVNHYNEDTNLVTTVWHNRDGEHRFHSYNVNVLESV